jgi:TetR/AcrR family transcriptional regulator, cholesterol catabolism regulator
MPRKNQALGTPAPSRARPVAQEAPEDRRAQILRVSGELFAQRGYVATTVRNIAEQAGLLSGSLYHHFDSKEEILDEILTDFVADLLEQVKAVEESEADPESAVGALIELTVLAIEEHRAAVLLLQNEWGLIREMPRFAHLVRDGDEIGRVWTRLIERGMRQRVFRDDVPAGLVYRFARDALWVAARWYEAGHEHSIEQIARAYRTVVFSGILVQRR